jgi:hypothetical protein
MLDARTVVGRPPSDHRIQPLRPPAGPGRLETFGIGCRLDDPLTTTPARRGVVRAASIPSFLPLATRMVQFISLCKPIRGRE